MDSRAQDVYLLFHTNPNTDSQKLIGVYSTRDRASKTIQKYGSIPGFCDFPDGYIIDEYRLDEDGWAEGFGEP